MYNLVIAYCSSQESTNCTGQTLTMLQNVRKFMCLANLVNVNSVGTCNLHNFNVDFIPNFITMRLLALTLHAK